MMIGVARPPTSDCQRTFLPSNDHSLTKFVSRETPFCCGPRQDAQSSAPAMLKLKALKDNVNKIKLHLIFLLPFQNQFFTRSESL
jgi:hypothetical protein